MAEAKKTNYGNESISSLKGADRVRKRPGVIFGSDGLDGCEHAVFEILSNSIDEAREGHGKLITVTRYLDHSIEVEDMGRGCPVDYNPKEKRFNWELVYCELYAGGKYNNLDGDNYEYSLGLNGLGACATQYSSRYMDVTVWRDGNKYSLHFERGEIAGKLEVSEQTGNKKRTGTTIRWLPDLDVFTDIDIPVDYYRDVMKRQAVVNAGVTFRLPLHHIPVIVQGDVDVGEHLQVRQPANGGAGPLFIGGQLRALQLAHNLAPLEVEAVLPALAPHGDVHVAGGVLGGAGAKAVETQRELVILTVLVVVLAAGVQLAEHQLPVVAPLLLVPVHGAAAAHILHLYRPVQKAGDGDELSVAAAGLVDGVGHDLKHGMLAALQAVGAKNDRRPQPDAVRALQRRDGLVSVGFLLFHADSSQYFVL